MTTQERIKAAQTRRRVETWMSEVYRLMRTSTIDHKGWEQSREDYLREYHREYYRRRKEAKQSCEL